MQWLLERRVMTKIVVILLWLAKVRILLKIHEFWILRAAFMCLNKDWFDTHKACDDGFVMLANNVGCKVVGIGTIKVKMLDGTVMNMGKVRHVPELGRNLISLSGLESLGMDIRQTEKL